MKLFKAAFEHDGYQCKAPGISTTEVITDEHLYAAESIEAVWNATKEMRENPEFNFKGIWEIAPMVQVLT